MFEMQKWISIVDWNESDAIIRSHLEAKIMEINFEPLSTFIKQWNGTTTVIISGATNRDRGCLGDLEKLAGFIFANSTVAYGIVYHSDEDEANFKVKVIRRGIIEEKDDTFLSPYFPMVEAEGLGDDLQ